MEFAGYDATLNRDRLRLLRDGAAVYLREPGGEPVEEEWWGWRPMVYDGKPVIDRSPAMANVVIAAGHGMLGLSMATGTGKLVAEMVTRGQAARRSGALLVAAVSRSGDAPQCRSLKSTGYAVRSRIPDHTPFGTAQWPSRYFRRTIAFASSSPRISSFAGSNRTVRPQPGADVRQVADARPTTWPDLGRGVRLRSPFGSRRGSSGGGPAGPTCPFISSISLFRSPYSFQPDACGR